MQSFFPVRTIDVDALGDCIEAVIESISNGPVELREHDTTVAVLVSSEIYEAILDTLDDFDLVSITHSRRNEAGVAIELDEL